MIRTSAGPFPLPNTAEELIKILEKSRQATRLTQDEIKLVWMAFTFARSAHIGQKRDTGEPYIYHPLGTAEIVASVGLDAETIAAALLHDVIEESGAPLEQVQQQFGQRIAALVADVSTLSKYAMGEQEREDAEAIRRLLLAVVTDARVVLIKLADELHQLRAIEALPPERQRRIARETLEIYAPIAERLGIWLFKWELEDRAFKCLEPAAYAKIEQGAERSREEHQAILEQVIGNIRTKLVRNGLAPDSFEITGRPKHLYSIYKKMHTPKYEGKGIDRIYDKLGIRVVVASVPDCYTVLGLVHSEWPPVPGEFDDYIGMRLPSGYQSLHTTVKYGPGKNDMVEFQIRTFQMHYDAELGIAAHWLYKEGHSSKRDLSLERKITWLRQMLEEPQPDDPESFVAILKSDVLHDRVYAFTPKGKAIDMPAGATPIDFAYHVHTDVGDRCRGARVNGRLVSLDYQLQMGDQVEILVAKRGGPSRDWLNPQLGFVKTQRARTKIKQWFKRQNRDKNILEGRAVLDAEFKRLGLDKTNHERFARSFGYARLEDFLAAIGAGDVTAHHLADEIARLEQEQHAATIKSVEEEAEEQVLPQKVFPSPAKPSADQVTVLGTAGFLTHLAHCCNPLPDDEIVGYITRGRGVTIHRRDCRNVLAFHEPERLIEVDWGPGAKAAYPVLVSITAYDRGGLLHDISGVVTAEKINMTQVNVTTTNNVATLTFAMEVSSVAQLSRVLARISKIHNVIEARRLSG